MIWSQESLESLPESELCQKVLVPLFEAMGYRDVEYHHGGALEQGKDIVMWREEPPKGRVNYSVVVKAKRLTGAAKGDMHEVLMQIKQSLGSSYIDKRTLEEQPIHQCYLVSSHEIKKEGSNSFRSLLVQENLIGRVFTIDGDELWALVRQHLAQQTIHAQFNSAYEALGSLHPDYAFEVTLKEGERGFALIPKHPDAEPIPVSLSPTFPDTPEGQRKREEFEKHLRTGARVELDQESVPFENLPEPLRSLFPFANGRPYTVVMGPSRPKEPIPMLLTVIGDDGSEFTLPTINFMEVQAGTDSLTFSNEAQPIPIKVRLQLSRQDHRVNMVYTFRLAGESVHWLVQCARFQKIIAGGASVFLRRLETGIGLPAFRIPPGKAEDWGEEFTRIAQEILEIQDLVQTAITIPERAYFTDEDVVQMNLIQRILKTGTYPEAESVNVTLERPQEIAKKLLDSFVSDSGASFFFRREHSELLLDQPVPLGIVETRIQAARVSPEDLEKLKLCATGKSRRKEISLRLMPREGHSIEITFPKWLRRIEEREPIAELKESRSKAKRQGKRRKAPGKKAD